MASAISKSTSGKIPDVTTFHLVVQCYKITYLWMQLLHKQICSSSLQPSDLFSSWPPNCKFSSVTFNNDDTYWCVLNRPWLNKMLSFRCLDDDDEDPIFAGGEGRWTKDESSWCSSCVGFCDTESPFSLTWLPQEHVLSIVFISFIFFYDEFSGLRLLRTEKKTGFEV